MKNKFLLLALISSFVVVSCSDDDDSGNGGNNGGSNNQTTSQKIANIWSGVDVDIKVSFVAPPATLIDTTIDQSYATYDFQSDGTLTIDSLGTTINSGTWALTSSEDLILDLNNVVDTLEILKITSTEFVYHADNIQPSPFGDIRSEITTNLSR